MKKPKSEHTAKAPLPKRRTLVPKGGDDNVRTPAYLVDLLVAHFKPEGRVLDPAKGDGAFYEALQRSRKQGRRLKLFWAELEAGVDFFSDHVHAEHSSVREPVANRFDWVFTNPPWSPILAWWKRGMQLADNVAYLCLVPSVFQKAKRRAIALGGFGIREIAYVRTPPRKTPWPQTGFSLGMVHIQKGYTGMIKETVLENNPWGDKDDAD